MPARDCHIGTVFEAKIVVVDEAVSIGRGILPGAGGFQGRNGGWLRGPAAVETIDVAIEKTVVEFAGECPARMLLPNALPRGMGVFSQVVFDGVGVRGAFRSCGCERAHAARTRAGNSSTRPTSAMSTSVQVGLVKIGR